MMDMEITTADEARDFAIDWTHYWQDRPMSWGEVAEWGEFFASLVERFPEPSDEFFENGVI